MKYILGILAFLLVASPAFAAIENPPETLPPTEIVMCKDGGWMLYADWFKNQGDCVSYISTDGSNEPDGPAFQ